MMFFILNSIKTYNNYIFKESKKSDRSDQKFLAILQYSLVFS
jgi:hypothetical protein